MAPAMSTVSTAIGPGRSCTVSHVPTQAATVAPTRSWPSTPMLNRPARKAKATASAAPMNGVDRPREAATRSQLPNMPRSSAQ